MLTSQDDYPRSLAAYRLADVLLVNPVRDGMNLVAKEAPVLSDAGCALVLSREAGAADELGGDALLVNPFDVSGTADALTAALSMDKAERAERTAGLAAAATALPPHAVAGPAAGRARGAARPLALRGRCCRRRQSAAARRRRQEHLVGEGAEQARPPGRPVDDDVRRGGHLRRLRARGGDRPAAAPRPRAARAPRRTPRGRRGRRRRTAPPTAAAAARRPVPATPSPCRRPVGAARGPAGPARPAVRAGRPPRSPARAAPPAPRPGPAPRARAPRTTPPFSSSQAPRSRLVRRGPHQHVGDLGPRAASRAAAAPSSVPLADGDVDVHRSAGLPALRAVQAEDHQAGTRSSPPRRTATSAGRPADDREPAERRTEPDERVDRAGHRHGLGRVLGDRGEGAVVVACEQCARRGIEQRARTSRGRSLTVHGRPSCRQLGGSACAGRW